MDKSRSSGGKFFVLLLLAFAMSIPGIFIARLTAERAQLHGVAAAEDVSVTAQPATLLGIRVADSYRATYRSIRYIPLFLGLVFLAYFLFECVSERQMHPAQYALVGVGQTVFYLLLLSLSERIGFDASFLVAGASTVALLSMNMEWLFRSRTLAVRAALVFALLYGFIYVLLRVDAYALLIGAVTSFLAVAAAMYMTRNLDWYSMGKTLPAPVASPERAARDSWLR